MEYAYRLIQKIKPRPGMYLGEASITRLQSFLYGYEMALYDHEILNEIDTLLPLPFYFFHEYVARKYNFFESTSGWRNMILEQVNSEEEGLNLFFELFDEFKFLKVEDLQSSCVSQEMLEFHCNNKYSPKLLKGSKFDKQELLYQNAVKIYSVKLSSSVGYIGFVKCEKGYEFIRKIYNNKNEILNYFQACFGNFINWDMQKKDNISFQSTST